MYSPIKFQLMIMKYQRVVRKALVDRILDMNATTTIVVASKASILEVYRMPLVTAFQADKSCFLMPALIYILSVVYHGVFQIDPVKYKSISSGFGVLLKEQGVKYATDYKTLIYLAASAFAELIADVALCPMEAVKVRVQTRPVFARGLGDGLPKSIRSEGAVGAE
ncbi:hypothetical protein M8C21_014227 [Ambrosia artemisiifolia]|uniref:Uncharacterized protein n=1 Tax=Ambrosia artemisiifolia TaxID=4212 RepID=A0AAD5BL43_AMBAR|nr:hypothetical protein M8C21_014227 [Ambrosia artemisiifolia]